MEKHSDEALVTMEETEGLCYLPVKRQVPSSTATPTNTAATSVVNTVEEQKSVLTTGGKFPLQNCSLNDAFAN